MSDWLRGLIWRDPILRIRCAWHVLQGRPLAYRLESEPPLISNADRTWLVDIQVRRSGRSYPDSGIVAGGNQLRIIRPLVDMR